MDTQTTATHYASPRPHTPHTSPISFTSSNSHSRSNRCTTRVSFSRFNVDVAFLALEREGEGGTHKCKLPDGRMKRRPRLILITPEMAHRNAVRAIRSEAAESVMCVLGKLRHTNPNLFNETGLDAAREDERRRTELPSAISTAHPPLCALEGAI
jgi:hypothetical protein